MLTLVFVGAATAQCYVLRKCLLRFSMVTRMGNMLVQEFEHSTCIWTARPIPRFFRVLCTLVVAQGRRFSGKCLSNIRVVLRSIRCREMKFQYQTNGSGDAFSGNVNFSEKKKPQRFGFFVFDRRFVWGIAGLSGIQA